MKKYIFNIKNNKNNAMVQVTVYAKALSRAHKELDSVVEGDYKIESVSAVR